MVCFGQLAKTDSRRVCWPKPNEPLLHFITMEVTTIPEKHAPHGKLVDNQSLDGARVTTRHAVSAQALCLLLRPERKEVVFDVCKSGTQTSRSQRWEMPGREAGENKCASLTECHCKGVDRVVNFVLQLALLGSVFGAQILNRVRLRHHSQLLL